VAKKQSENDDKEERKENADCEEGVGPRFQKGSEDLDQLEGIEKRQARSRRARREHKKKDSPNDPDPDELGPLIDDIEKSRRRLKNQFKRIKTSEDAFDEFGS